LKTISISPAAAEDLMTISEYLEGESGDPFLGDRFLSASASTLNVIEDHPSAGRVRPTHHARLFSIRSLGINPPFDKYLVFYQSLPSETLILRVLHGAQDLGPLMDVDTERDA
jgi:plasmid stabilization system protein ParE